MGPCPRGRHLGNDPEWRSAREFECRRAAPATGPAARLDRAAAPARLRAAPAL